MKAKTARALKWIAIVLLALGVLYAVLLASSTRSLRRAYANLEADGRPMSANEIIPPPLGVSENADALYEAAALQLKARASGNTTVYDELSSLAGDFLKDELEPSQVDHLAELLGSDKVRAALDLVDEGASRPGYRRELNYSNGAEILLPHLSELRNLTRIQCARARIEASQGRPEEAWHIILSSLNLADSLRTEPILISQLVRMAQFGSTASAVQDVCAIATPEPEFLAELQQQVRRFENQEPLALAFDGDRLLLGEWAVRLPRKELPSLLGRGNGIPFMPVLASRWFRPLLQADHAAYLRLMRQHAEMALQPYSADDERLMEQSFAQIPRYCTLTRLMTPALVRAKTRHLEVVASAKITRAGLAILAYQIEHDASPPALDAVDVPDARDPFGGGALRYEPRENGFLLYSIGPNLNDEGGQPKPERGSEPDDIGWDYVEPGKR